METNPPAVGVPSLGRVSKTEGYLDGRFKETALLFRPNCVSCFVLFYTTVHTRLGRVNSLPCYHSKNTALNGGSLGTCVDEERSQLRELV